MKKIILICIAVVVLALIWFWLDNSGLITPGTPEVTPSPSGIVSNEQLEQELDASLQGNIESEFQGVDQDINSL